MTAHVDLDGLADLLVGEGGADAEAQVAHVADCAACSARLVELGDAQEQVLAALAALPEPVPPPGLSDRLEAALRAAAPVEAAGPVAGSGPLRGVGDEPDRVAHQSGHDYEPGSAVVVPITSRRRPIWLLSAAAGLVALLLGGAVVLTAVRDRASSHDALTAAAASSPADSAMPESAAATALPAPSSPLGSAPATTASGRDYASGGDARAMSEASGLSAATAATALSRLLDPTQLAGCLDANGIVAPEVLDYAAYDGAPALAVLSPAADPGQVEVVVVGADCATGRPDRLSSTTLSR